MHLMSNISQRDLELFLELNSDNTDGIKLLTLSDTIDKDVAIALLTSKEKTKRLYGAMIARKMYSKFPELLDFCQDSSDQDLNDFSELIKDVYLSE